MKKVLLVSAFAVLALASCKKDYKCSCKIGDVEVSSTTINDTKKKAADKCSAQSASALGIEKTCSIVE